MAKDEKSYHHEGWLGQPLESDFQAHWGLVPRSAMFDARGAYPSVRAAVPDAIEEGFDYVIGPRPSARDNWLYRIERSTNLAVCVYARLENMKRAAAKQREKYRDPLRRFLQLTRVHLTPQQREEMASVQDELLARWQAGTCEATGIAFEDTAGSPFAPIIMAADPDRPLGPRNFRVVVAIYARMSKLFLPEEIDAFVLGYARRLSARSEPPEPRGG